MDYSKYKFQQTMTDEQVEAIEARLPEKQKRFIDEFLIDFNPTKAAERAGYSKSTTYGSSRKLLGRSEIREIIGMKNAKLHSSNILEAQQILEMYSAIARGEIMDQFGLDPSLSDRLKALDALAKRQIDFQMKVDANAPTELTVRVELPDKMN